MKKAFILFLLPLSFVACTGTNDNKANVGTDSSATAPALTLPYTAVYSSNFVPGKQSDVLTVLNNYKTWENNDMKGMRETLGDTVTMEFPNGMRITKQADSLIKMASLYRDSISSMSLTLIAWTSNHSVDKNEDWVNVWYKEVDTYKNGKMDSTYYEDDNRLKDGKIVLTSSHSQKIPK